jgi:hypothetical protein
MSERMNTDRRRFLGGMMMTMASAHSSFADPSPAGDHQTRDLHLVMGSPRPEAPVRFRVTIDGSAPGAARGLDIDAAGNGTAAEPRLYQLVRQPAPIVERTMAIEFLDAGVEAYSFTFG